MISALIPVCEEIDGMWICTSRCMWGAGFGVVTGTGATKKLAYAAWIDQL